MAMMVQMGTVRIMAVVIIVMLAETEVAMGVMVTALMVMLMVVT